MSHEMKLQGFFLSEIGQLDLESQLATFSFSFTRSSEMVPNQVEIGSSAPTDSTIQHSDSSQFHHGVILNASQHNKGAQDH